MKPEDFRTFFDYVGNALFGIMIMLCKIKV